MVTPRELNMVCGESNEINGEINGENCFELTAEKKLFAFD